jgi:hypothetical protein
MVNFDKLFDLHFRRDIHLRGMSNRLVSFAGFFVFGFPAWVRSKAPFTERLKTGQEFIVRKVTTVDERSNNCPANARL